jgi:hypothetical protein
MSGAEDHCREHDHEQQPGQDVDQYIQQETRSGPILRHETERTDGAYIHFKEVFVAYLLLIVVLAVLIYAGWRVMRAANRPKTRVIGPDDDPDFLRRLGHGDNNPRP